MKKYNEQWDSYYDDEKDIWLESPCQYEDCEFCSNRPAKPSECVEASSGSEKVMDEMFDRELNLDACDS